MLNSVVMHKSPNIRCPTCGARGDWFAAPYGAFCSRRCKLVDLGKWFGEEHLIASPLRPDNLEKLNDAGSEDGHHEPSNDV
jgi:endogenous inhibitor of DNA gyrase (YacG/DUF329 family)